MTAKSQTITDFLLARIVEDEAVAHAATHQKVAGPSHGHWHPNSSLLAMSGLEKADRTHIARFDPDRILRECGVKRRIIELHEDTGRDGNALMATDNEERSWATLRALAFAYADHPDFDPDWIVA